MEKKTLQEFFLDKELWLLSIRGAFGRANIYNKNISDIQKKHFKNMLKGYIDNLIDANYRTKTISEEEHIENILALSEYTSSFAEMLQGEQFNFGVSQKLLNLHLKYLYCIQAVKRPPHFPVDSIIQKELKVKKPVAWTQMKGEKGIADYNRIIAHAKEVLKDSNYDNLVDLELYLFDRK